MFCFQCGKSIEEGSRFCCFCGASQDAPAQSVPVQPQSAPTPYRLYMDAKGLTLFNYKFDIKDAAGNLRYRAATVTEGVFTYHARVYYPNDAEAMGIHQQKKLTFAAMNFDIVAPNGSLVTEVLQKLHFATTEFQLPQLGLTVTGDFFSLNFSFMRGNQVVAAVCKKVLAWGDCYELEYYDPNLEQVLLATIMVIQIFIAASRQRRRRR